MSLIRTGSMVVLKTGGPAMTVQNESPPTPTGSVFLDCAWFQETSEGWQLQRADFDRRTLELIPEKELHDEPQADAPDGSQNSAA